MTVGCVISPCRLESLSVSLSRVSVVGWARRPCDTAVLEESLAGDACFPREATAWRGRGSQVGCNAKTNRHVVSGAVIRGDPASQAIFPGRAVDRQSPEGSWKRGRNERKRKRNDTQEEGLLSKYLRTPIPSLGPPYVISRNRLARFSPTRQRRTIDETGNNGETALAARPAPPHTASLPVAAGHVTQSTMTRNAHFHRRKPAVGGVRQRSMGAKFAPLD